MRVGDGVASPSFGRRFRRQYCMGYELIRYQQISICYHKLQFVKHQKDTGQIATWYQIDFGTRYYPCFAFLEMTNFGGLPVQYGTVPRPVPIDLFHGYTQISSAPHNIHSHCRKTHLPL